MNRFQFNIADIVVFTAYSAVAAWLVSVGFWWLVPILVSILFVYTSGQRSGYQIAAAIIGGIALGIGLVLTCLTTYYTFFHAPIGGLGLFRSIMIGLTLIVWLITLILFLQFRRLLKNFKGRDVAAPGDQP